MPGLGALGGGWEATLISAGAGQGGAGVAPGQKEPRREPLGGPAATSGGTSLGLPTEQLLGDSDGSENGDYPGAGESPASDVSV